MFFFKSQKKKTNAPTRCTTTRTSDTRNLEKYIIFFLLNRRLCCVCRCHFVENRWLENFGFFFWVLSDGRWRIACRHATDFKKKRKKKNEKKTFFFTILKRNKKKARPPPNKSFRGTRRRDVGRKVERNR